MSDKIEVKKEKAAAQAPIPEPEALVDPQPLQRILDWCEQITAHEPVSWERLPEIDLYMDQVITYMDKQLCLFQRSENNKLLTSSMINNYVKDGLLPRPQHKKYSREHLAGLMIICLLKQVLSIPDISTLAKELQSELSMEELHEAFSSMQKEALSQVCQRVNDQAREGEAGLKKLALILSVEANARRIVAERILSELDDKKK